MSASARPSDPPRWGLRLGLLLLALLLAALPAIAQQEERRSRSALTRLLESQVPGLRVDGLRGPLARRPGFERLTIADAQGVWLEIEDVGLDWSVTALVRRRLEISDLTAARVVVHRLPAGDPGQPPPEESGPLIPEVPSLPLALRLDRFQFDRIELAPPVLGEAVAGAMQGRLRLDSEGLDLALDAVLEGGAVLTMQAVLRPAGGALTADATFRGEAGGLLSRLAGLPDRPLAFDLSLRGPPEGAQFTLSASAGEGIRAALAGTIVAPDTARLGADLTGEVEMAGLLPPDLAPLAGPAQLALDAARQPDGRFALRRLRAAGAPGTIEASGDLDFEGQGNALTLRAALAGSELFAPLLPEGAPAWESVALEGRLAGALAAPQVALTLAPEGFRTGVAPADALLGPAPRLALRGAAPDRIEALTLTGQALTAEASGRAGETLDLAFRLAIAAAQDAVPGLAGAATIQGSATGPAADPTLTIEARSDRLEAAGRVIEALALSARIETPASRPQVTADATGRVEQLPLSLALRGAPEEEGWLRLDQAEASFGPALLTAAGRLQPRSLLAEGQARLAVPDLAPFARLLGQPIAGAVTLEARGSRAEGAQRVAARLAVPALAAAGVTARGLIATAEGTLGALDVTLAGTVNDIAAEARGKLSEAEAGARILDLAALRATAGGETIRLAAPTRVTLRPDGGFDLARAAITLPRSGTLTAEGRWGPEQADLRATLTRLDLAGFAPFAPGVAPSGTITGEARVTGPVAAPEVTATLRGTGLGSGLAPGLPRGELRLSLRRAASGLLTADGQASLGPQNRLTFNARFPQGPAATAPFEGRLDGTLDAASLSAPFLAAGADRVAGRLTLALRASGTPAAPELGGEARIANGAYRNGALGVALTDIAGALRPQGERLAADLAGRTPNNGRFALSGTIAPLAPTLPVALRLTATNAQPISSDLLRAVLDADLRLGGALGTGLTLAGPVTVRRADILVPDRFGGAVRTLQPVREIGTPPGRAPRPAPARRAAASPALPTALDLVVEAPRQVFVRGRGLDAELGGRIAVGGTVAAPQIDGAFDLVRGELSLAGRRLAFERGRLAWTGELLPDLALRATSQSGGYALVAEVSGPPSQPALTFTSTPELPPDEVLARLLFDRQLRELGPFEIAQIAAAIAGQTGVIGGGEGVLGRLRQELGLDRLAVGGGDASSRDTTQERGGPTLEAGRYVADGIYVGVRQGTDPGSTRAAIRVDLTRRLRLEAETGDREAGNRVGLSYEWEWGR
jgi:translocation and assembly module TamB